MAAHPFSTYTNSMDGIATPPELEQFSAEPLTPRSLDEVVARAQALSRMLAEGKAFASVDEFLAARRCEAKGE